MYKSGGVKKKTTDNAICKFGKKFKKKKKRKKRLKTPVPLENNQSAPQYPAKRKDTDRVT